jgi:methylmalonyl-CoA/ethylmalonyl-CoA epimerase
LPIKRIDHIAIVVPNVEEAANFYQDALGLKVTHVEQVDRQDVIVAFLPAGESEIELVEPVSDTSGVSKFLGKRGPGVHHLCLEVDNLEDTLARLKDKGIQLIDEQPTIGSGGKKIAFIHPRNTFGVLIELYEATAEEPLIRASILDEMRTRFVVERQAVSAGVSAFLRSLRVVTGRADPTDPPRSGEA